MSTSTSEVPSSRLGIIDAIRGFAILGILFANIQSWSGYLFVPFTDLQTLSFAEFDSLFYSLHKTLVDGKFYSIFSMLFGVGFALQYNKKQHNQAEFIPVYRRRLSFLLLFGLCHTLIWSGDILTLYALLAFLMVSLRNISPRHILWISISLFLVYVLTNAFAAYFEWFDGDAQAIARKVYPDQHPSEVVQAYGSGNLLAVFQQNLHNIYWRWVDMIPNGRISRVLALFLLGFYMGRTGYFSSRIYQWNYLIIFAIAGIGMQWLAMSLNANMYHWAQNSEQIVAKVAAVSAQVFLALMYMSILAQIYRSRYGEKALFPLTQIGRMAFTNYFLHTVVGISLFYGIGFGLFGQLALMPLWVLAAVIFGLQVLLSNIWLSHYKQGPLEWLWGCLTKGKFTGNKR